MMTTCYIHAFQIELDTWLPQQHNALVLLSLPILETKEKH